MCDGFWHVCGNNESKFEMFTLFHYQEQCNLCKCLMIISNDFYNYYHYSKCLYCKWFCCHITHILTSAYVDEDHKSKYAGLNNSPINCTVNSPEMNRSLNDWERTSSHQSALEEGICCYLCTMKQRLWELCVKMCIQVWTTLRRNKINLKTF